MADLFGHEAPPVPPGSIEIECEIRDTTRDAIAIVSRADRLVLGSGRELWIWLPLKHVETIQRGQNNFAVITVPEWLAREKGML